MRNLPGILGLSAALTFSSGCGGDSNRSFPDEDRLLESLMEEYVAGRFRFYPVESTQAGLPGNDDRLGSYSQAEMAARIASLSDFHKKLMGLRPEAMSQPAYLDALWLTSLTKAELFDLEERRLWQRTASFYTETIRAGLVALLLAPDIETRTDALRGRLEAIPTLLEQARENLGVSSGVLARDGLASVWQCANLLADLPLILEDRVPSYRVAELAEQSRLATRALQQLESALARAPLRDEGMEDAVLGAERLTRYFLYREMVDWPPERILQEAEAALGAIKSEMLELALERLPDRSPLVLLGSSRPPSPAGAEVSSHRDAVLAFLRENEAEAGAPEGELPVIAVPPYFLAPEKLKLWRPASLSPAREASLLVAADPEDALSRELELLTVREIAGRYRLYAVQSESPSLLRRIARSRASSDGWASRLLSKQLERGYGGDDAELRLRQLHLDLLDALRLSTAVRIHAFGLSLSDAESNFRTRGYLSPERAEVEAERAVLDPDAGSAALGRILLDQLARELRHRNPLLTETELERLLLSESLVPLRLVRFKLLGVEGE